MTGASLSFLGGALAPQVVEWPRIADLADGLRILVDRPALAAALGIVAGGILAYLPRPWRRCSAWVAAGALAFWLHAELLLADRLAPDLVGDSLLLELRVLDFPHSDGMSTRMAVAPVGDDRVPRRLRLTWIDAPVTVRAGDIWMLETRLRPPYGNANPGGMDLEGWLFRERIGATGYVVNGVHNRLLASGQAGILQGLRERFVARVLAVVGAQESASVLAAVVVGARHLIRPEQWDRYARTGTSHLMAISGLHIGLAASGTYFVVLALTILTGRQFPRRNVALLAALVAAIAYACVSGLALPARRAALMLGCAAFLLLLRREPSPGPVVAFAALVIALADPVATMAPGFRLSFCAVVILIWLAQRLRAARTPGRFNAAGAIASLVVVQFALFFGLLPLTILDFARIALAAPLLNLVAVPLFSFVTVPLGLLALLLDGPLATVGDRLLAAAAASIDALEDLIGLAARAGWATDVAQIEGAAWVALAVSLAWVVLPPGWPGRWSACVALLFLVAWRPPSPGTGCLRAGILDVGQGLAVVLETRTRVVLFDAGPRYRSGSSAGETIVLPYLRSRARRQIDLAVISHPDVDHAGGLAAVAGEMPVRAILAGHPGPATGARPVQCAAGMHWRWDGVDFTILGPPPGIEMERNDASCVLLVTAGQRRMLFTGDIEETAEAALVRSRRLPVVDLATVPHHGSSTSSTMPFVLAASPAYAVVPAARHNQWGFPEPDVVARWRAAGAEVLVTGTQGAILVDACDGDRGITLREYRSLYRRIWHADN